MLVALNYGMKLINFFSVQAFESLIMFKYVSTVVVGRCMHLKFFVRSWAWPVVFPSFIIIVFFIVFVCM